MKRPLRFASAFLLTLALFASSAHAGSITVGAGAFGGTSIPIVQDDARSGPVFGTRIPVTLTGFFSLEPYFAGASQGDGKEVISGVTYTRDGFGVTAFGINAVIGRLGGATGFRMYPFAGVGSYKLSRAGSEDIKKTGFNFGLGFGISPVQRITLNLRGQLDMIVTDSTSRKFGTATLGVSYDALQR